MAMTERSGGPPKGRALIIGGSMAGLFSGLLLHRIGWDVHIFERVDAELASRGAGIVTHHELIDALGRAGIDRSDEVGIEVPGRRTLDRGGNIIGLLVVAIVMPIAATLIRMAISRAREFQADATGAYTSGNPEALATALEKLERGAETRPMNVAESASHLFIVNPLRGKAMARLFSTHPPIEERARRLRSKEPNY